MLKLIIQVYSVGSGEPAHLLSLISAFTIQLHRVYINSFSNTLKVSNSLDLDQVEKKLFGLIWTQTVCKGYQQMAEVSKVFLMSMKVLCIGSHYMLKLCFNVRPSEYDHTIHIHRLYTQSAFQ